MREFWKLCGMFEYKDHLGYGDYVIGKIPPRTFNTENHNYDSYHNIISFSNGCVIYTGSLDNYKSLDGMEVAWSILDETKDTRPEAVSEVILGRIRQKGIYISDRGKKTKHKKHSVNPFNPLYIFTSPAKVEWINDWFKLDEHKAEIVSQIRKKDDYFMLEEDGKLVTISSAYLNEDNLPEGWVDNQKKKLPSHLHGMLIYGDPFSKSGGEFYKCFNSEKHVKACLYDPALALHISFDFNVAPYMTLTIWQIENKDAYQISEICLSSPDNNTRKLCQEFVRNYNNHTAGLFIYGDATGKARNPLVEEDHNHFTIIEDELYKYRAVARVGESNPSVVMRGNFINTIFESNFGDITITIDPSCKNTIADYTYLKENSDGKKFKEKTKNAETNATYEKYGHTSDANDYFFCEAFSPEYQDYQEPPLNDVPRTFGRSKSKSSSRF